MLPGFHTPAKLFAPAIFTADTTGWKTWSKPRGISMVSIFCVGSGAGGGAGYSAASNLVRGGGGGGSCGGVVRFTGPAFLLPDLLYILVGSGVPGGQSSGNAGTSGNLSYVAVAPSITGANVIVASGGTAPGGGGAGSTTAGGVGSTGNNFAIVNGSFAAQGLFLSQASIAGGASGAVTGANGVSVTALASHILTGGGGGGSLAAGSNTDYNGGNITGAGLLPTISGGAPATNGADGLTLWKPFCAEGGGGGGTSGASGTGGAGGRGGIGSGGGGGGAGVTGGAGGNGGDGIVIITFW